MLRYSTKMCENTQENTAKYIKIMKFYYIFRINKKSKMPCLRLSANRKQGKTLINARF